MEDDATHVTTPLGVPIRPDQMKEGVTYYTEYPGKSGYNKLPIQTDAEKRVAADARCLHCEARRVPSDRLYVHIGRNSNPQRLFGHIGSTWQLRCIACDYAASPDFILLDREARVQLYHNSPEAAAAQGE